MVIHIFTDGSALGNGKVGARGGVGVFFGDDDERNISEPFTLAPITNNRAELVACIRAIETLFSTEDVADDEKVIIHSDSIYVIKSMTEWIVSWKKRGWKNSKKRPVENKELIIALDQLLQQHPNVSFQHVSAHGKKQETPFRRYGNDRADELAVAGAKTQFYKISQVRS